MSKDAAGSTLYRLIEAGQLARLALVEPLSARGLEPGDDAVLLGLEDPAGVDLETLEAYTGFANGVLEDKLRRLEDRGLLLRLAVGAELVPGARLSQQGYIARGAIEAHWRTSEDALADALGGKGRKGLRRALKKVIALLRR